MATRLEVPIFGSASAAAVVKAGVSRIELNAEHSYPAGGLTPSLDEIAQLRNLAVPVRVMIRHRGRAASGAADFVYSDLELEAMEKSIETFKDSGLLMQDRGDGFVFGVLEFKSAESTSNINNVEVQRVVLNVEWTRRLVAAARPFQTVFHRAYDEIVGSESRPSEKTSEWELALEDLVTCGVDGILTSGGPGNAVGNMEMLRRILHRADNRIEVIVGGGVRSPIVGQLSKKLFSNSSKRPWVHSSCLTADGAEEADVEEASKILAEIA